MGSLLAAAAVTEAPGTALTQVQTDTMEFIAQDLSIGLAIMGTIPVIIIGVKVSKRFTR